MNKNQILNIFDEICKTVSPDNAARYMRGHFPAEYSALLEATSFLDKFDVPENKNKKISIFERIYCLRNGFIDRPKCKHCGVEYVCGFNKQLREYRKWCSAKCQASDPDCIAESKMTRLNKYGDETYHGVEKAKETRMAKNGGKWHAADFGRKVKQAKIENGHASNWVNPEKAKSTKLERYGCSCFNNTTKNKITRKTNFYATLSESRNIIPAFTLEEYLRGDKNTVFEWKCLRCGTMFSSRFNYNFKCSRQVEDHVRCPTCFPHEKIEISNEEVELFDFVRSIAPDAVQSDRTVIYPQELDVYVPSKKLALEFDGLYWHNDENKPNLYHLDKTNACMNKGVMLLHVFEDEWLEKRAIVESRIKNTLGVYSKTVFARKCRISEVDAHIARIFQNENHLQGAVNSAVRFGLYLEDELVALMTFGKCRFDKKHEWEMLRFCCRLGYHVPGAAGKLLAKFEKTYRPKSLVSYADKRWSIGRLYEALGFRKLPDSKPNYFYIDGRSRISRIRFQKHKLAGLLENFDPGKSEVENMRANGYRRIFDCGNMVFEKTY